ncbi:MAG: hypothetical protein C4334_00095 [Pyrinomonas sp.]
MSDGKSQQRQRRNQCGRERAAESRSIERRGVTTTTDKPPSGAADSASITATHEAANANVVQALVKK